MSTQRAASDGAMLDFGFVTTNYILRARGAKNTGTLARDLRAGLFAGCEPQRTSAGAGSRVGTPYVWNKLAVHRARWLRNLFDLGLPVEAVQYLLQRGFISRRCYKVVVGLTEEELAAQGQGPGELWTVDRRPKESTAS